MNSTTVTEVSDDSLQPPDPRTSRQLFRLGLVALAVGMVIATHNAKLDDPLLLVAGNLVMLLGALPALNWARTSALHFPVFEMFMLTAIPFYAVSLLGGHPEVLIFSPGATLQAVVAVILFQVCAIGAFMNTKGRAATSPYLCKTLLPAVATRYAQTGLWLNTAYLYVYGFTDWIPLGLRTVFRAMFFGIGTVSLFIEMRRWGAGQLQSQNKFAVVLNVAVQLVFLFRDLYLISGISILLLALIGYVSTSRRVPIVAIVVMLPVLALLHNGKAAMRTQYWEAGLPPPALTDLPDFFSRWIENGLEQKPENEFESSSLAGRLFERASLFQMLCLVTERTPEHEPFLVGESYKNIPAQLVPSFLWPGKPSSLLSNILLAVHYRLVPEDNPTNVSIAFGMIAESYANFGLVGCAALGLLLGFGYKRVCVAAVGCPQFSALGLLTILLAAWSFQVEQIFATWLVSLVQAAFVVIGLPVAFRLLFHQE